MLCSSAVTMKGVSFAAFIIISFLYAIFTGRVNEINNGIFESVSDAVELSITFLGTICLWNGIMKIAMKTSLVEKLTRFLKPIVSFIFPFENIFSNFKVCYGRICVPVRRNIVYYIGIGRLLFTLSMYSYRFEKQRKNNGTI